MNNKTSLDYLEVFPWNRSFEIGIQEIDDQHKQLINLLNRLVNTLVDAEPVDIDSAFSELADYADYHFAAEEAIWQKHLHDDDWVAAHQNNHASFLPKVLELKEQDSNKPYNEVIEDIIRFLIRWLAFHIIDDDKRLAIAIQGVHQGQTLEQAKQHAEDEIDDSIHLLIEIVLSMYDNLSNRTLTLMRERRARIQAEQELKATNKQLQLLSITDQLTGLYNRRHFDATLNNELRRARRDGKALILTLFDVDFFKKLNDRYGHNEGDRALQQVAATLLETCRRPTDFAFRIGGEEFAVITSVSAEECGAQFGNLIRNNILEQQIPNEDSPICQWLTISAGVIAKIPDADDTLDSLLSQADRCLYEAKRAGRNQVIVSD